MNTVCEEAPGRILIGTEGSGLRRISHDSPPKLIVSRDGVLGPKHRVSSLLRCRDGTVLAAVSGKGVFRVEDEAAVAVADAGGADRRGSCARDVRGFEGSGLDGV